jgi:hypothetical protein
MAKETLTAKVSPKNLERLESYADREGISKSEATDRLVKQGLDVEESDMRLVPVKSDGGTKIEDSLGDVQSQLNRIDKDLQDVESQSTSFTRLTYLILGSLIYLGIEITSDPPTIFTVSVGFGLIVAILYQFYHDRRLIKND